jgi:hypothetical protein
VTHRLLSHRGWTVSAGRAALRPAQQIIDPTDRITFRNSAGDTFEVYLEEGHLVVRTSGSHSPAISVRPHVSNVVHLEMVTL